MFISNASKQQFVYNVFFILIIFRNSIVASIPACHAGDQGSIGLLARMKHLWRRRRDVGEIMVQNGYAVVAAQGLFPTSSSSSSFTTPRIVDTTAPITTITDTSTTTTKHTVSSSSSSWSRTTIQQQRAAARHDVRYWHQLVRAEYQAVQSYAGIWSHPQYRQERSNVVDERHFQQQHQSSMIQKFFRWIRGA